VVCKDNGRKDVPEVVICVADLEKFRTTHNKASHLTFYLINRITILTQHTRHCCFGGGPASVCCAEPFLLFLDILFEKGRAVA
jgi:hypothetical protein